MFLRYLYPARTNAWKKFRADPIVNEMMSLLTLRPCRHRLPNQFYLDARNLRRFGQIEDEQASNHARRRIGLEVSLSAGGISRAQEDHGLSEADVERVLVWMRLQCGGHG